MDPPGEARDADRSRIMVAAPAVLPSSTPSKQVRSVSTNHQPHRAPGRRSGNLSTSSGTTRGSEGLPDFKDQAREHPMETTQNSNAQQHHSQPVTMEGFVVAENVRVVVEDDDEITHQVREGTESTHHERRPGTAAPHHQETDPTTLQPRSGNPFEKKNNRRGLWIGVALLVTVLIAGAVVGGFCGAGGCGGSDTGGSDANTSKSIQDPLPGAAAAPTTTSPTAAPTTPPTTAAPSAAPTEVPVDVLISFINGITLSGATVAYPPSVRRAPEELALAWLIESDPLPLDVTTASGQFRLRQRFALLTFWFSMSDVPWERSTYWTEHMDECEWFGISCEERNLLGEVGEQRVVTEMDFPSNNMQGTIPADLGLLTNLRRFVSDFNDFSGTLPDSISLWTDLEVFDVSF